MDGGLSGFPYPQILRVKSQETSHTPTLMVPAATYATRFITGPRSYAGIRRCLILRQMLSTVRAQECTSFSSDDKRSIILPVSALALLIDFDQYPLAANTIFTPNSPQDGAGKGCRTGLYANVREL